MSNIKCMLTNRMSNNQQTPNQSSFESLLARSSHSRGSLHNQCIIKHHQSYPAEYIMPCSRVPKQKVLAIDTTNQTFSMSVSPIIIISLRPVFTIAPVMLATFILHTICVTRNPNRTYLKLRYRSSSNLHIDTQQHSGYHPTLHTPLITHQFHILTMTYMRRASNSSESR